MSVAAVREHLDAPLRVTLTDKRILIGRFACFDKQRNVLLNEAREFRSTSCEGRPRSLGIVLVPWRWIVRCDAERR